MMGIYFAKKWKAQRFGKIIKKMSEILTNQKLSIVSVIHKVSYSSSS